LLEVQSQKDDNQDSSVAAADVTAFFPGFRG
jgi:hypothetical protein